MVNKKEYIVEISHLQHRGYGVATTEDGLSILCLNALPGEKLKVRVFKKKKGQYFAHMIEILRPSPDRIEPREDHFCSCSPWQILKYDKQKEIKEAVIRDEFKNLGMDIASEVVSADHEENTFHYRNKVEFSFYAYDDESLSLAFFKREGGFGKYPLESCVLMHPSINRVAADIVAILNKNKISNRRLKGLLLRASFETGEVVAQLYTKDKLELPEDDMLLLSSTCKAFEIIYSDKRSPAFVHTDTSLSVGDTTLNEVIAEKQFVYPLESFFQVNRGMFTKIVEDLRLQFATLNIRPHSLLDLYGGVGTLGILFAEFAERVVSVDITPNSAYWVQKNAELNGISNISAYECSDKEAVSHIEKSDIIIVDPPRVGLHQNIVDALVHNPKEYVVYISCNPLTQARDMTQLKDVYEIAFSRGYDLFSHTPHIEHVIILQRK